MRREEILRQRQALLDEANQILERSGDTLTEEDAARFDEIEREVENLDRRLRVLDAAEGTGQPGQRRVALEHGDGAAAPQIMRREDPYEPRSAVETPSEIRSRALTAIEQWQADDELKEGATATVERASGSEAAEICRHVLRYGNPAYVRAFRAWVRDPETFAAELSQEEARAWRDAREHARATLNLAGSVLPSPLDPAITLVNDGVIDPMRRAARVDQTTSNEKRYITSAGSNFSWDAELEEVSDDTPALAEVTIKTEKAQGWLEASLEAFLDQPDLTSQLAGIIADGRARIEGPAFINGTSGANEPIGLITRLTATTHSQVSPTTQEAFTAPDVTKLMGALPPRFRARAAWMGEFSTLAKIDQFESAAGARLYPGVFGDPGSLLGRPIYENSSMAPAALINSSTTSSNPILVVGDFSHYVILDRIGTTIDFASPATLVGASNRPTGRVGWYIYWRCGADVLDRNAFRVLNVETQG